MVQLDFRARFFDDFDQNSVEGLGIQTKVIHHFKALVFSSLELREQRTSPPNEAATHS